MFSWLEDAMGDWFAILPFVLIGVAIYTVVVMIWWGIKGLYESWRDRS
jgi:sterol desaturase/sphingolipid hydroxylase (fatty acid hydroxylase superfamily)